jgi:hypothetical protein
MEYNEVTGAAFAFAHLLRSAKRKLGDRGHLVHVYSPDEYRAMRLFLAEDWQSGFAVKADGDIVSVFSLGKGRLGEMLQIARENGGKKLDCFEPLAPVYQRYGFEVTDRADWSDEYAPANWNYAALGRPAVLFLSAA